MLIRIIVTLASFLILRGTAWAADVPPGSAAGTILEHVVELIGSVLGVGAMFLVKKVITYVEAKTRIDIPAATEDLIADWAARAAHYAEEKAYQAVQAKAPVMKGPQKLETALSFAVSLAEEHGLDQIAKDKLVKYIEAHLGTTRDTK